ncbi:hypothetical protein MBAV_003280 [Candidatus Magnetobacterium bavaricum]|uniref:Thoeris protein ThsB TIR-like domain-containing protein n=1 Tax=Candidatus Magnetobacterium bavaricum TaxID=29290 RepID=A0A0F3GRE1_9BACT|nr:hypothetical protein MBAV_003280 [Candidatus Magnetobacterium bavaricum]
MKIFVAYGFNDRDKWIKDLVFPIIEAFRDEVINGANLKGEGTIDDAIKGKIEESDALIGFTTRREKVDHRDEWSTHRWVTDEIAHANATRKPIAIVIETGVKHEGMIAGFQYIPTVSWTPNNKSKLFKESCND